MWLWFFTTFWILKMGLLQPALEELSHTQVRLLLQSGWMSSTLARGWLRGKDYVILCQNYWVFKTSSKMLSAVLYAWLRTPLQEKQIWRWSMEWNSTPCLFSRFNEKHHPAFRRYPNISYVYVFALTDRDEERALSLSQWFSNLRLLLNQRRPLLKCSLLSSTLRVSDLVGLGWGLRICVSSKFPGEGDGSRDVLWGPLWEANLRVQWECFYGFFSISVFSEGQFHRYVKIGSEVCGWKRKPRIL